MLSFELRGVAYTGPEAAADSAPKCCHRAQQSAHFNGPVLLIINNN